LPAVLFIAINGLVPVPCTSKLFEGVLVLIPNLLFLISALSPQALRQQYRRWSLINLLVFTILLIAFIKIS
jgi:hypothetical protein